MYCNAGADTWSYIKRKLTDDEPLMRTTQKKRVKINISKREY